MFALMHPFANAIYEGKDCMIMGFKDGGDLPPRVLIVLVPSGEMRVVPLKEVTLRIEMVKRD